MACETAARIFAGFLRPAAARTAVSRAAPAPSSLGARAIFSAMRRSRRCLSAVAMALRGTLAYYREREAERGPQRRRLSTSRAHASPAAPARGAAAPQRPPPTGRGARSGGVSTSRAHASPATRAAPAIGPRPRAERPAVAAFPPAAHTQAPPRASPSQEARRRLDAPRPRAERPAVAAPPPAAPTQAPPRSRRLRYWPQRQDGPLAFGPKSSCAAVVAGRGLRGPLKPPLESLRVS